tara:strand:+ start:171 stop:590 length:420 start_codon:yes stop_codon:yes gene_type:complete
MDDRPVRLRTSASAQDFWSRARESNTIDPYFHEIRNDNVKETIKTPGLSPYQRQQKPFSPFITARDHQHKSTQTNILEPTMDDICKLKAHIHILEARNRALETKSNALDQKVCNLNKQLENMCGVLLSVLSEHVYGTQL